MFDMLNMKKASWQTSEMSDWHARASVRPLELASPQLSQSIRLRLDVIVWPITGGTWYRDALTVGVQKTIAVAVACTFTWHVCQPLLPRLELC